MQKASVEQDWVFLNIPYDAAFERLYLAYIAGICGFRLTPHTALEIPDTTRRLDRIQNLLHRCRYSIHDVSRARRFNMPFELGLAVTWSTINPRLHSWFVCDSEPHRISRSLSDLAGTDINIHDGTVQGVMRELCNIFVRHSVRPDVEDLMWTYRELRGAIPELERRAGSRSIYEARMFADICFAAKELVK